MLEANLIRLRASAPSAPIACFDDNDDDDVIAAAIAGADGVLISGGGNMSSHWPGHLQRRIFAMREAADRSVPVVLGGQTIGPDLTRSEQRALGEALASVSCVGVRDVPSAVLAADLGVSRKRILYQVDDAFLLAERSPGSALALAAEEPYLAVTLDASFGGSESADGLERIGEQLAELAEEAGLRVILVPHVGPRFAVGDEDGAVGRTLRDLLDARGIDCTLAPVLAPPAAAWLARRAAAVISSRFHAVVFGLAGAVPCLALYRDGYTRVKLQGALAHLGLQDWTMSAAQAQAGRLGPTLWALWRQRAELREAIRSGREAIRRREQRRWHHLLYHLGLHAGGTTPPSSAPSGWPAVAQTWTTAPGTPRIQAGILDTTAGGTMLTEDQCDSFSRDGFLHLGQVVDLDEVEALRTRADDLALGNLRNEHVLMQLDTGGAYEELPGEVPQFERGTHRYRKIQGLEQDDLFRPLVVHPLFMEICSRIYGRHAPISIFRAMIMNKPAGQGTVLPWHQDGGDVWKLDRDPLVTIWLALDSATVANGCMEAVRGSHLKGLLTPEGSNLSDEHAAVHCPPEQVVPFEVPAGHAVLLHNWLIHRSGVNPSPDPRRAMTVCYMDGRTMSILTGDHFPIVAGSVTDDPYPYVGQLEIDRAALAASVAQAEEYAASLKAEVDRLNESFRSAEEYAHALTAEVDRLTARCRVAEEYAQSLDAERTR